MAAALVLDHRGIVTALQVAVQIKGVFGKFCAVEFAENHVEGHVFGVFGIEVAIAVGLSRDGDHACPKIGMGQADVPNGVATHGIAGQVNAIGVDGKPAAGVAERVQYGRVLPGGVVVLFLMFQAPLRGDYDVTVSGRMTVAGGKGVRNLYFKVPDIFSGLAFFRGLAGFYPFARPPVDLAFGVIARAAERDNGGI